MKSGSFRIVTDNDIKEWLRVDKSYKLPSYAQTKIYNPRIIPRYIDCHGLDINNAYHEVMEFIDLHSQHKTKKITVVTGKSGSIRKEFESWLRDHKQVRYFKLRPNKGSWDVFLRY